MDPREVQRLVDDRLRDTLKEHKESMLSDMEKLLDKISGNSNLEQIDKISSILTGIPKFKRKSNEEQFKYNSKISAALESTENLLQSNKIDESRQKIAEVKELVAHRQRLIRLADGSDLGWRLVNEYEANPLADGSDDEKKILKAEARANKKMREERAKKARSARHPYKRKAPVTVTNQVVPVAQSTSRRPPGLCFACGKPGHWKGSQECPANSGFHNKKISSFVLLVKYLQLKMLKKPTGFP